MNSAFETTILSRRGNNVTPQYSVLLADLSRQPVSELVLDGEIIAMDEKGRFVFFLPRLRPVN